MICEFEHKIFTVNSVDFDQLALETFHFQYHYNPIYRLFADTIDTQPSQVKLVQQIPFLPISFFKTHSVTTGNFDPAVIFESSGTTGSKNSRHLVKDPAIYQRSFLDTFQQFYGPVHDWCILGLLPSYLERGNSSLVMMADELIRQSGHPKSGFYLYNHAALAGALRELENANQKTLLIGVTYALLDFAEKYPMELSSTTIMETGGMKGRREELTREQVHARLQKAFAVKTIHSEYGMTELLSQAYSNGNGIFSCPAWMRIFLREEDDPFEVTANAATGVINVIDLANIYSCSFIATDDAGRLYEDGSFEVLGRIDNSDIRGCSLLSV